MNDAVHVTAETLRGWPLPTAGSEKHRRGVVLVVAGSDSTPGAARLAGEAALRTGAGQLKIATAASVAAALGVAVPEARVGGFAEARSGDLAAASAVDVAAFGEHVDAALVGPGFLDPGDADAFVAALVATHPGPYVLDALASAWVGRHREQVADLAPGGVLTLNPSELGHVLDLSVAEVERDPEGSVAKLVAETGTVVLLGGETKVVGGPLGTTYVVTAGGPGLAVSGSGDVQAGLVVGLLARGAEPHQAAVWGAWLHATAGERVAVRTGPLGFLARELAAEVPGLLAEVAGRFEAPPT